MFTSFLIVIRTDNEIYPLRKFLSMHYSIANSSFQAVHKLSGTDSSGITETLAWWAIAPHFSLPPSPHQPPFYSASESTRFHIRVRS